MPAPRRAAAPSRTTLADQLRAAIAADGRSEYLIGQAAEVPRSCVSDFMAGRRGLTLDTLDRLCEALGLRLVESGRRGGARRGARTVRRRDAPQNCQNSQNTGQNGRGPRDVENAPPPWDRDPIISPDFGAETAENPEKHRGTGIRSSGTETRPADSFPGGMQSADHVGSDGAAQARGDAGE